MSKFIRTKSLLICAAIACITNTFANNLVNPNGRFNLAVTGLYLQPGATNADLNIESLQFEGDSNSKSILAIFEPDYKWSYQIYGGYAFPCSVQDITLGFRNYLSNTNNTFTLPEGITGIASFTFTNLSSDTDALRDFFSKINLKYKLNLIDLRFGHEFIKAAQRLHIHPSVGVNYLYIHHHLLTQTTAQVDLTPPISDFVPLVFESEVKSNFRGVGPIAGIDLSYNFYKNFSFISHFASALSVGKITTETDFRQEINSVSDTAVFQRPSLFRVVTLLEGSLAVGYEHCFNQHSKFKAELGYLCTEYFNSIDLLRANVRSPFDSTSKQKITDSITNDFYYRGPYLSFGVEL